MKFYWTKAAWTVLASAALLSSCKKDDNGALSGPVAPVSFDLTSKQAGLATEVTLTNTSGAYSGPGIAFYSWDFGDGQGSAVTGTTIKHLYTKSDSTRVRLCSSARGGNNITTKIIVLPDVVTLARRLLAGGSSRTWKLDVAADSVITVGPNDSDVSSYYNGPRPNQLPACQGDDEYTFSNSDMMTYDAKGSTFVANVGCSPPQANGGPYTLGKVPNGGAGAVQMEFKNAGSFIGVTNGTTIYRIMSISADGTHMVIRAGKAVKAPDAGLVFQIKLVAK